MNWQDIYIKIKQKLSKGNPQGFKRPTKKEIEEGWKAGDGLGAKSKVIREDGQWVEFIPKEEKQKKRLETYNCTNFGTLNAIEIITKAVYGIDVNWCERYLGVTSNTQPWGNSPHRVGEAIRKWGSIDEIELPFTDEINTWNKYYFPKPMTEYYLDLGEQWLERWQFTHKWISPSANSIMKALKYSPVGFSTYAWLKKQDGIYYRPRGYKDQHWVVCVGYVKNKYWVIYDSYAPHIKKIAWWSTPQFSKKYSLQMLKSKTQIFIEQYSGRVVKGGESNGVFLIDDNKKKPYISWDALYAHHPLPLNRMMQLITVVPQNILDQIEKGEPQTVENSPNKEALKNLKLPFTINKK